MRAARIDGNQNSIVAGLRKVPGITVAVTSGLGKGFPDIVVGFRSVNYLFEIKDPAKPKSKRVLTPDELRFHDHWAGQIAVVETIDDILRIMGAV